MKNLLWIFVLLGSLFLIYGQSLRLSYSLFDDGQIILKKRQIIDIVKSGRLTELNNVLFEPEVGRVRPVYWWMQSTFAYLAHESPVALHSIRILILIITLALIYRLLRLLKISSKVSFLGLFLYLVNFQNVENYLRLGPTEPLITLILIIILNIFVKNPFSKYFTYLSLSLFPLIGVGIKETFIVNTVLFLPFTYLINKKHKYFGYLTTFSMGIGLLIILIIKNTFPKLDTYSYQYQIYLPSILSRLQEYVYLLCKFQSVGIIFIVISILTLYKNKVVRIFLLGLIINLIVLLPWKYVLNRYLLPANLFLIIIFTYVYQQIYIKYSKNNKILTILSFINIVIITLILYSNIFNIANYQYFQLNEHLFTNSLITNLNKNLTHGTEIVSNYKKGDDNIEIYVETLWHLQLFHSRWDLKYSYLDMRYLCTDVDRYILDRRSDRLIPKVVLDQQLELIASYSGKLIIINRNKYIKNILTPKLEQTWIDNVIFDWSIYKQKANTCISL